MSLSINVTQYKICLLVHLSHNCKAPSYISTLLQPVSTLSTWSTVLRSESNLDLFLPRSRLKLGERAFSIAAPKSWNTLPLTVRQTSNTQTFKRRLKTFLFCKSYSIPIPSHLLAEWHTLCLSCSVCIFYHLYFIRIQGGPKKPGPIYIFSNI